VQRRHFAPWQAGALDGSSAPLLAPPPCLIEPRPDLLFVPVAKAAIINLSQCGRMPQSSSRHGAWQIQVKEDHRTMHSHRLRLYAEEGAPLPPPVVSFQLVRSRAPADPLRPAIARARQALLGRQRPDGSFLESQVVDPRSLAMLILARAYTEDMQPNQFRQEARGLLAAQQADGGWSATEGGALDLSISVLAYLALKLSGQSSASEPMVCARRAILARGGATQIDAAAQLCLALLGQYPYEAIAAPTLERLLIPTNSGADMTLVCQAVVAALRPRRYVPCVCGIRELLCTEPRVSLRPGAVLSRWCRRRRVLPLRRNALAVARARLLDGIGGWRDTIAGCQDLQAMAWTTIALDVLGFTAEAAPRQQVGRMADHLLDYESDAPLIRASTRETVAETIGSLIASGLHYAHLSVRRAVGWLERLEPAGTADAADQLCIATMLRPSPHRADGLPPPLQAWDAEQDGHSDNGAETADVHLDEPSLTERLLDTQRPNGAWSEAAGKDDVMITAKAVYALAQSDIGGSANSLTQAAKWLQAQQRPDGSWPAAHGTGAVAGTSRVLRALIAAGVPGCDEAVSAGVEWMLAHQQPGGGWGDAAMGSAGGLAGEGAPNARCTAAALLALLAAGHGESEAAARGVDYLIAQQDADGQWSSTCPAAPHAVTAERSSLLDTAEPLLALGQFAIHDSRPRQRASAPSQKKLTVLRIAPWSYEAG